MYNVAIDVIFKMKLHFQEYDYNRFLMFCITSNAIWLQFNFKLPSNYCYKITYYSYSGISFITLNEKIHA